jgi:hypothetical protein
VTIASRILATSPYVYLKLDETSGSVATDSSGHGRNGAYSGDLSQGQTGPEQGTYACRLFGGSKIQVDSLGIGDHDLSMLIFATTNNSGASNVLNRLAMIGNPLSETTRGPELGHLTDNAGVLKGSWGYHGTSLGGSSSALVAPSTFWHSLGLTYVASTKLLTGYMDGASVGTATVTNRTAPLTTDPLYVVMHTPEVVAHVAVWDRQLTSTEFASVGGFTNTWPYGLNLFSSLDPVTLVPGQPDFTAIADAVAALQSTLNGITTVTFPSLNDLLNTISGKVTAQITTGAGVVQRTLGQIFSWHTLDALTLIELTPGETSGQFCHTFGGTAWGIIIRCTTVPDWYGTTGPGDTYKRPSLGELQIIRGIDVVYSAPIHQDHLMLYPIPGAMLFQPDIAPEFPFFGPGFLACVTFADGVAGHMYEMHIP